MEGQNSVDPQKGKESMNLIFQGGGGGGFSGLSGFSPFTKTKNFKLQN